jgi:hypothetical protein
VLARSVAHNHTPKPPKQVVEQWRTSHKGLRCLFVRALWESAAVKDFSSECDITRFEFSFFLPIIITTATRTITNVGTLKLLEPSDIDGMRLSHRLYNRLHPSGVSTATNLPEIAEGNTVSESVNGMIRTGRQPLALVS